VALSAPPASDTKHAALGINVREVEARQVPRTQPEITEQADNRSVARGPLLYEICTCHGRGQAQSPSFLICFTPAPCRRM
jgi:hypothetical protein